MTSDLYAETTARIIEALEHGTPPWVRPWSTVSEALPMNAQSRRPYRGINFTLLSLAADTTDTPSTAGFFPAGLGTGGICP